MPNSSKQITKNYQNKVVELQTCEQEHDTNKALSHRFMSSYLNKLTVPCSL